MPGGVRTVEQLARAAVQIDHQLEGAIRQHVLPLVIGKQIDVIPKPGHVLIQRGRWDTSMDAHSLIAQVWVIGSKLSQGDTLRKYPLMTRFYKNVAFLQSLSLPETWLSG